MDMKKVLERNKIVEMYAGSRAYGTNLPTSDVDIRGIFVADPASIRTPFFNVDEIELPDGDTKFFELNKFVKLVVEQNPNVVELLWTAGQDIIVSSPAYEMLRQYRGSFLTSKIAFSTTGYALAQLKRIKGHNKWISQQDKGVMKLQDAYKAGDIDIRWLEENFSEEIVRKVIR